MATESPRAKRIYAQHRMSFTPRDPVLHIQVFLILAEGMTFSEMIRRNKTTVFSFFALISILYLLLSAVSNLPNPRHYFSRPPGPDHCKEPKFHWRGANDRLYPASGKPVYITHLDYSHGLANHQVSINFARSQSEDFSITTDIYTSHEVPTDNFEISYNSRNELSINTLIPKNAPMLVDEATKGTGHCVVINVEILVPVSKPLTGLKFDFPEANVHVHDSTWGSIPYLEFSIGKGDIQWSSGQRFHIGKLTAKVDEGSMTGNLMLTEQLKVELKEGTIDLDIGYSPFLIGAEIDIVQFSGTLNVKLQDLFYRPTVGTYWLSTGTMTLDYPQSYEGLISMDSKVGSVGIEGSAVHILERSEKGILPAWLEAQQGRDRRTRTKVRGGTAEVKVSIAGSVYDSSKPLIDANE